ncbi:MAG: GDSL-type esterase/lipase family protein [Chitinophagaceae bacterium]|nr:GDSL-type esterase/lipase family protein [Chitinophagaceae bacterium]
MPGKIFIISVFLLYSTLSWGQRTWNEVSKEITEVEMKSSADGSTQKAMLYKSPKPGQPLIVHLHAWSASYQTIQPELFSQIQYRDYNYIYPHFRGPNNHPEACGSDLVISDIEDAIEYALKATGADRNQVHLVGSSGGGGTVMNCYMRLKYPARSFSAWCAITDIESWYWEVLSRGYNKYADDIMKSTSSATTLNIAEAHRRSPMYYPYPAKLREGASLSMYAGIHDGYIADVPVTQTINMYNKIAKEKYPNDKNAIVPDKDIIALLSKRSYPNAPKANIGDRKVHYHKQAGDVEVVIFEGGHERLDDQVIGLMPVLDKVKRNPITFLTLGDANATAKLGWANQLGMIFPYSTVVNRSIPGQCLGVADGFLNSLHTIDTTLISIRADPDYIVIGLGTNDARKDYAAQSKAFPEHMRSLISKIKNSDLYRRSTPKLIILSCLPYDEHNADQEKYSGAKKRLVGFNRALAKITREEGAVYIDAGALITGSGRLQQNEFTTSDGVTLTPIATRIVVEGIAGVVEKQK